MGTDMTCRTHLKKLHELLIKFEAEPKLICTQINKWFLIGEDLFKELFQLGISVNWKYSDFREETKINEIVPCFTQNYKWIECFISQYPRKRIDLDLTGSAGDICKVRSGIEVLLEGFRNINNELDKDLENLRELGEVEEFDNCLKLWIETGYRPSFKPGDKPSGVHKDHWWWI
ncbi:unnamed protein product [Leptidea sinapis]|uniref:Uncharacterized protein n=1 Tax=Leptidea sinapis TaxID=189913 RepID=A0A5E4R1W4_9NEOP|nr:unnamed protein product [Leptidea sinapis]